MHMRNHLSTHTWWGKLVGLGLGFVAAGPSGALLGLFVGNLFDRGLRQHLIKPHLAYHHEKETSVKQAFQRAIFSAMGQIAKADGRVSEREIEYAKTVMRELQLNRSSRLKAQRFFIQAKEQRFNLNEPVGLFKTLSANKEKLRMSFIQIAYHMAEVDGLTPEKVNVLNQLLSKFNLAPLHKQAHARDAFYHNYHQEPRQGHTHQAPPQSASDINAYRVLNIPTDANKQEVKRAYRKLVSKYHPDKHIANGATHATIQAANEKTQTIRKAYEIICEQKGW